jgi:hypothetical protein
MTTTTENPAWGYHIRLQGPHTAPDVSGAATTWKEARRLLLQEVHKQWSAGALSARSAASLVRPDGLEVPQDIHPVFEIREIL